MRHARKDYQERIIDTAEALRTEGVNYIPEDEPVFLLRAKDVTAPSVVRHWAMLATQAGADERMVRAALEQAQAMSDWQKEHGSQCPDMPEDEMGNETQDQFNRDYYNTNREKGATLRASREQARKQQEKVLLFFQDNPFDFFPREKVNELVMPEAPYTSVQRCLTNLTDDGFLEKTMHMVMGGWGKMVHTWRLRQREMRQETLF